MKVPPFKTEYVIVDVTKGRKRLENYFAKGGPPVRVALIVEIDRVNGMDDGTSIEFCANVVDMKIKKGD